MGAEDGDSPYDFDTDFVDLLEEEFAHSRNSSLNQNCQMVLPCYGRGKRLSDIQVPHIPLACTQQESKGNSHQSKIAPFLRRRGTGRAEALKNKFEEDDNKRVSEVRPGGLASYGMRKREETQQKAGPSPIYEAQHKSSGWTIAPSPYVVQLDSLPMDIELEILLDIVAHYGTIVKTEIKKLDDETCIRFRFADQDACELLVTNLDNTDFLGTGKGIKCFHFKS